MGGSEATIIHKGVRHILAVTYKGEGAGAILFHQQSWDPAFLSSIDPGSNLDILALIGGQVAPKNVAIIHRVSIATCCSHDL